MILTTHQLNELSTLLNHSDKQQHLKAMQLLKSYGGVFSLFHTILGTQKKPHGAEQKFRSTLKKIFLRFNGGLDLVSKKANGDTCLILAIKNKSLIGVQRMLSMGANPNFSLSDGRTALFTACSTNGVKPDIVQELLNQGANPNQPGEGDTYPLVNLCAIKQFKQRLDILVEHKDIDLNVQQPDTGISPLYNAALTENLYAIRILIKKKANPNILTQYNETPLFACIETLNWDCARELLKAGTNPNIPMKSSNHDEENSLLHLLVHKLLKSTDKERTQKILSMIKLLLSYKADPLMICGGAGSPLAFIFEQNLIDAFNIFEPYIADFNQPCNQEGHTLLMLSCFSGYKELTEKLLAKNVDVDRLTPNNISALYESCASGDFSIYTSIISRSNKHINLSVTDNITPLCVATQRGDFRMVQDLLKRGANPRIKCNGKNQTALHTAAGKNYFDIVQCLLPQSAINATMSDGATPIFLASQEGHLDMVEFLLAKGADPTIKRKDTQTCLFIAYYENHHHVANYLLNHFYAKMMLENGMNLELRVVSHMMLTDTKALLTYKAVPKKKPVDDKSHSSISSMETITESDIVSGFKFLQDQGFSKEQIQNMRKPAPMNLNIDSDESDDEQNHQEIKWEDLALTPDSPVIRLIESQYKSLNCYLYIDEASLIEQGCDDIQSFTRIPAKFAATQNDTGIIKLQGKPAAIGVIINKETKSELLTDEIKLKNSPARILCYRTHADDGRSLLYVGCVYAANGLHKPSDKENLPKTVTLSTPETTSNTTTSTLDQPQSDSPRHGPSL